MSVPEGTMAVIRRWFLAPAFQPSQAVANALQQVLDTSNSSDTTLGNLATDTLLGRDAAGTGPVEQLTVGGGLAFTGSGGLTLSTTGVTAGTYGDASHVAQFTVGADGRVTAASNVPISGGGGGGGTPGGSSGQVQFNNAGAFGGFTVSGDGTLNTATGALTVTKTSGTAFGYFATGTDAGNLSGTVSVNRFNSGTGASSSSFLRGDGTWATPSTPLVVGFILNTGATGTSVAPIAIASRAGSFSKCKVVTKASDGATALTFRIKQNGMNIFTSNPSIPAATGSGTISTFTTLTSVPLSVSADDLFTIDVTSGSASWQATIQLEP